MYPKDIYKDEDFEPMGYGQLTNVNEQKKKNVLSTKIFNSFSIYFSFKQRGKSRSYQLGKLLRERYDKFLGHIYKSDILEMTSTDYDRTKISALLVLAGLYPPEKSQLWNDQLKWLPMPYNFDKTDHDYVSNLKLFRKLTNCEISRSF